MRKTIVCAAVGLFSAMAASAAHAGNVPSLVQMVSGQPAKAADVNSNFDALKTANNDNDARITVVNNTVTAINNSLATVNNSVGAINSQLNAHVNNTALHTDTLAGLSCTTDQIAKYDGSKWVCATMSAGGAVEPLMVYSADGVKLGRYLGETSYNYENFINVFDDSLDSIIPIVSESYYNADRVDGVWVFYDYVYFSGLNCTGTAYASESGSGTSLPSKVIPTIVKFKIGSTSKYYKTTEAYDAVSLQSSVGSSNTCQNYSYSDVRDNMTKLVEVTLPFTVPVAAPLEVR